MAKKVPDFSVRPVVIRKKFLKGALFVLALGSAGMWFALNRRGTDDFDYLFLISALGVCLFGLWGLMSGPMTVRIGDDTIQRVLQNTWWSLPSTTEWPISDFECVRLNSVKWEDGSKTWDIWLRHADGQEIHLEIGARDEDYALQFAHDAARALNLPMLFYDP